MRDNINWENASNVVGDALYSGFARVLVDISHKNLANFGNRRTVKNPRILEIGAGRGEHFRFVRNDFSEYVITDVSDWGLKQIENIIKNDSRVSFELQNIEKLDFPDDNFDRVICSCVLIHVDQPFEALLELDRVTKPGGVISFYLACDPGLLLRLMRFMLTAPKMRNLEVPYALLNALSHRNNVSGLLEISKHIFRNSQIKFSYFPFHLRSWNLSTHVIVNVVKGQVN